MRVLLGLILAVCIVGFARAQDAAPDRPRIAVVSIELAQAPNLALAAAAQRRDRMQVDLYGLGGGLLPSVADADLGAYDLVIIEGVGPQLAGFADQIEAAKRTTRVVVVNGERWVQGNVDVTTLPDLQAYWTNATAENYARLLDYLTVRLLGLTGTVAPPVIYPETAFYHPDAQGSFPDLATYEAWETARLGVSAAPRPRIGLLFYRSQVLSGNARVIDALIREVERQGGTPLPLWRKDSAETFAALSPPGAPPVDAVILCSNWVDYQNHEAGVAAARRLDAPLLNCTTDYSRTPEQWEAAEGGFAPGRSGQLALSELEGIVEPMMVGARVIAPTGEAVITPITHQVEWRVARAMAWARLRTLPNAEKRLVIPYYSEGRSEADVGSDPDSYLDAQGSLIALLNRLRAEGYDVGDQPLPDRAGLSRLLAERGSNPADAATLAQRVRDGSVVLIPEARYRQWWLDLPETARVSTEAQWGSPPGDVMVTTAADGTRSLVIPMIRFGKIALAPHPIWGMQEPRGLETEGALTPHHQYIAFYLWMRKVWRADAYLPLFTQLSLMPGKQEGPSSTDWIGLLIGDLPHIQPVPLQANGGVSNKRRANAVLVGFMPELAQGGLAPDLEALRDRLALAQGDPALQPEVRRSAAAIEADRVLGLDPATAPWSAFSPALATYLDEIDRAPITLGGHTLGEAPDADTTARMIQAMVAGDAEQPTLDQVRAVLAGEGTTLSASLTARLADYAARIGKAGQEMDAVIAALSGRYVEPGPNQDAIRNPDALPGGRNPYTLDPRELPTPQAWALGSRLADEMVADYRVRHGEAPRKTAFVLWSGETVQNGGVLEAQILRLLGARPVWNAKGQVVDVALDDAVSLGRGRIDVLVTTSGAYRDHFGDKMALIARAVALAAAADEPGNQVRSAVEVTRARLVASGVAPDVAEARALRRVFSTAPGAFSPVTEFAIQQDPRWTDDRLAALYAGRLSHAYGADGDAGAADGDVFADNLRTVDAAVFGRSSNVYGLLDTPMPAAYLGGLNMAVRQQTGRGVELYIARLASPETAHVEPIARTFGREMRSRYLNPAWIQGMQADGYNGARYLADFTDNMMLWDVTTPDLVQDADWEAVRDVYVRDRYRLGLKAYSDRENPAARRRLLETLVEAIDRGAWKADAETKAELRRELAASPDTGRENMPARSAPGPMSSPPTAAAPGSVAPLPTQLRGFEMEEVRRVLQNVAAPASPSNWLLILLGAALLFGTGSVWRPRW